MKLPFGRKQPTLTVDLPQNLPVELPESLSLTVPEGAVQAIESALEGVSLPAVVPEAVRSIEIPRNLPARVAERLPEIARAIRLPSLRRVPTSLSELQQMLHIREREIRALQAQANRNLAIGVAVGTAAGAAIVLALLPDREARIAEIRSRLGGLDAPAEYVEDARRLTMRARESIAERIRIAREEARQVEEETKRELWARFEVAKREGRQPPPA